MEEQIIEIISKQDEIYILINEHLANIESGLQTIIYIAVFFFIWQVIKILYRLFGGVFLGGV